MAFIELRNITKAYGEGESRILALDNINLSFEKNEFVVILGPSGAGKSTLLNVIGGMDYPTSGSYLVNNREIANLNNKELAKFRRKEIGFVFQFYNLMANLTALENVSLAARKLSDTLDPKKCLELVGLSKRMNNFPSNLSGGEQQRVSIARAIVKKPHILLCDEPTGALDSKTGKMIISLLKDIASMENQTVIIVTHNANIAKIAERVIHISDGKIVADIHNENPLGVDDIEW